MESAESNTASNDASKLSEAPALPPISTEETGEQSSEQSTEQYSEQSHNESANQSPSNDPSDSVREPGSPSDSAESINQSAESAAAMSATESQAVSQEGQSNGNGGYPTNAYDRQTAIYPSQTTPYQQQPASMPPALMQQPQSSSSYPQAQRAPAASSGSTIDPEGDITQLPLKTGTVRWFNATKGYGFVGPNDGGSDAFVHQNQLRCDGYRSLDKEQVVEYRLKIGPDGKHIALAVTAPGGGVLPAAKNPAQSGANQYAPPPSVQPQSHPSYGAPSPYNQPPAQPYGQAPSHSFGQAPAQPYNQTPTNPAAPVVAYDGRNSRPSHLVFTRGTVKSWDTSKGYGFLKGYEMSDGSPVSTADLFVHQNNVHAEHVNRQLVPGMRVEYTQGIDEKNHKPLAQFVTGPNNSIITRQDIDRAAGVIGYGQPSAAPRGVTLTGHIERFDPAKKYGFIKPDSGSQHVFLHASRINMPMDQVRAGMRVSFQMGLDHQGKDAAVDVVPLDHPAPQSSGGYERGRSAQPGQYAPPPQRGLSPTRGMNQNYDPYASSRERVRSPPRDYYDPYRQPPAPSHPPAPHQLPPAPHSQYAPPPVPQHDPRMYQPPPVQSYAPHPAPVAHPPPHDPYYAQHAPPPPVQPQYGGYQPPPPVPQQPVYNPPYHAPPAQNQPPVSYAPHMPPPNQYAPQPGPPTMHYQPPASVMSHAPLPSHMQPQQQPPMHSQGYVQHTPMTYSAPPPSQPQNDAGPNTEIVSKLYSLYQTLSSKP